MYKMPFSFGSHQQLTNQQRQPTRSTTMQRLPIGRVGPSGQAMGTGSMLPVRELSAYRLAFWSGAAARATILRHTPLANTEAIRSPFCVLKGTPAERMATDQQTRQQNNSIADFMLGHSSESYSGRLAAYLSLMRDQLTSTSPVNPNSMTMSALFPTENERGNRATVTTATRDLFAQNPFLREIHRHVVDQTLPYLGFDRDSVTNTVNYAANFNAQALLNTPNLRLVDRIMTSLVLLDNRDLAQSLRDALVTGAQQHFGQFGTTALSAEAIQNLRDLPNRFDPIFQIPDSAALRVPTPAMGAAAPAPMPVPAPAPIAATRVVDRTQVQTAQQGNVQRAQPQMSAALQPAQAQGLQNFFVPISDSDTDTDSSASTSSSPELVFDADQLDNSDEEEVIFDRDSLLSSRRAAAARTQVDSSDEETDDEVSLLTGQTSAAIGKKTDTPPPPPPPPPPRSASAPQLQTEPEANIDATKPKPPVPPKPANLKPVTRSATGGSLFRSGSVIINTGVGSMPPPRAGFPTQAPQPELIMQQADIIDVPAAVSQQAVSGTLVQPLAQQAVMMTQAEIPQQAVVETIETPEASVPEKPLVSKKSQTGSLSSSDSSDSSDEENTPTEGKKSKKVDKARYETASKVQRQEPAEEELNLAQEATSQPQQQVQPEEQAEEQAAALNIPAEDKKSDPPPPPPPNAGAAAAVVTNTSEDPEPEAVNKYAPPAWVIDRSPLASEGIQPKPTSKKPQPMPRQQVGIQAQAGAESSAPRPAAELANRIQPNQSEKSNLQRKKMLESGTLTPKENVKQRDPVKARERLNRKLDKEGYEAVLEPEFNHTGQFELDEDSAPRQRLGVNGRNRKKQLENKAPLTVGANNQGINRHPPASSMEMGVMLSNRRLNDADADILNTTDDIKNSSIKMKSNRMLDKARASAVDKIIAGRVEKHKESQAREKIEIAKITELKAAILELAPTRPKSTSPSLRRMLGRESKPRSKTPEPPTNDVEGKLEELVNIMVHHNTTAQRASMDAEILALNHSDRADFQARNTVDTAVRNKQRDMTSSQNILAEGQLALAEIAGVFDIDLDSKTQTIKEKTLQTLHSYSETKLRQANAEVQKLKPQLAKRLRPEVRKQIEDRVTLREREIVIRKAHLVKTNLEIEALSPSNESNV